FPACTMRYSLHLHFFSQCSRHHRDLHSFPTRRSSDLYDLIVFPGHHEYVTSREYDVVRRYRDAGGNLMFLFANDFFWRIVVRGRSEEHTSELQSLRHLVCRLLLEKKKKNNLNKKRILI